MSAVKQEKPSLDPALAGDDAVIALLVLLHDQGSIAFEDDEEGDDAWDD